jgi:hypothetical protein
MYLISEEGRPMFDAFLRATGEPPFADLTAKYQECYRLKIETSLRAEHKTIRMQRRRENGVEDSRLIAHFFVFGRSKDDVQAATYEITLGEEHWRAMEALLAVARFWDMTENAHGGFDGSTYTLEAWKAGRSHEVKRWSPNVLVPGGELFSVVTDYLERLAELAMFECDVELLMRYAPEYVPKHRPVPRGNLA